MLWHLATKIAYHSDKKSVSIYLPDAILLGCLMFILDLLVGFVVFIKMFSLLYQSSLNILLLLHCLPSHADVLQGFFIRSA